MRKSAQFDELIAELLKGRPDLGKVRQTARQLGLRCNGNLVDVMAEVLELSGTRPKTPRSRRKSAEAEA
jgi:hypothetical protein